eukprot:1158222_1
MKKPITLFSNANRCTCVALVGMATVILSVLYRKRQTRMACTVSFWNELWEYIHNTHSESDEEKQQLFDHINPYLHIDSPSDAVFTFLSTIIDRQLNQIIIKHLQNTSIQPDAKLQKNEILHAYLEQHPLQILVPLCGSSYDLYYISFILHSKYHLSPHLFRIIGIESSSTAIVAFFTRNNMCFEESVYNPKYTKSQAFDRIWMYSNESHGIHILHDDIFRYFHLLKTLQTYGIAPTPCLIEEHSIDIIVDINAMSCCNPSDRKQYVEALKYWLSD